jgi:hypothetical protein
MAELDRLLHAGAVTVGAISTPQINKPKFGLILSVNQRVAAGDLFAVYDDSILRRAPEAA